MLSLLVLLIVTSLLVYVTVLHVVIVLCVSVNTIDIAIVKCMGIVNAIMHSSLDKKTIWSYVISIRFENKNIDPDECNFGFFPPQNISNNLPEANLIVLRNLPASLVFVVLHCLVLILCHQQLNQPKA